MKSVHDEIVGLLKTKGKKLGMNAGAITYSSKSDPGPTVTGYLTRGVRETINIPDEYMKKAGANNAQEFLSWLKSQ